MERSEFENKVLPLSRNLYRFAFRILSNGEDAEDAVQEVCIKMWNMRAKLKEYRSIEALAVTMTRNHCLDRLRKKGRELYEDTRPIESRTNDVDLQKEIENKDIYRRVIKIISELPDKYRRVIEMRDISGLSYDEIESELDENLNTIRVNLSRARKMVREKLIKMHYEPARTG